MVAVQVPKRVTNVTCRLHRAARRELGEIIDWYDSEKEGLGGKFAKQVAYGIRQILAFPEAWQTVELGLRHYLLAGFPYGLVYHVRQNEIIVIAVMHLSRKPGYWKDRI